MCYNQTGDISTLEGTPLKVVDKFTYLGSSVESTEKDIETRLTKAWTAINRLSIIWKSDLTDKMKRSFFQAAVTSILLYGCTTWTLTKRLEKKLDGNYTRMLRAILNKSWQQHPTRHQLYGHLPPITKTIQVRRTRHAGHCWRSRDELIRDVLLWIPTHSRAKAGRPARTYIQQLCEDTGCCPEDLPRAMNDRDEWRERVRDIRATSVIWWWWWLWYNKPRWYLNLTISLFIFLQKLTLAKFSMAETTTGENYESKFHELEDLSWTSFQYSQTIHLFIKKFVWVRAKRYTVNKTIVTQSLNFQILFPLYKDMKVCIYKTFLTPSGCDIRLFFMWCWTGLNSEIYLL